MNNETMKVNDEARITKIKSDHAELLRKVRESILENQGHLSESVDSVITVLDFDEKSVKRYEATVNAQELIVSLTKEIVDANTKEEVFELRKKLNSCINRIKAEIKKRDLDEKYLTDYQEKASYLRKDIAKYIRFLKREDNIAEIDRLYSNFDHLTEEEMTTLKKALRREVNYNHRNLNPPVPKTVEEKAKEPSEKVQPVVEEMTTETDASILNPVFEENEGSSDEVTEEEVSQDPDFDAFFADLKGRKADDGVDEDRFKLHIDFPLVERPQPQYVMKNLSDTEFSEIEENIKAKVQQFYFQYNVEPTLDYSRRHLGLNVIHFFRNLPRYIRNRNVIKRMMADYCMFYNGNDFGSFIEYVKRRNSIRDGLKCMFSKSHLYSNEDLIKHERCARWIYDFCKRNSMNISFEVPKTI